MRVGIDAENGEFARGLIALCIVCLDSAALFCICADAIGLIDEDAVIGLALFIPGYEIGFGGDGASGCALIGLAIFNAGRALNEGRIEDTEGLTFDTCDDATDALVFDECVEETKCLADWCSCAKDGLAWTECATDAFGLMCADAFAGEKDGLERTGAFGLANGV